LVAIRKKHNQTSHSGKAKRFDLSFDTMTYKDPFDEALTALGPAFMDEVRTRIAPVKDRIFAPPHNQNEPKDGLKSTPWWLSDPELRKVFTELGELAVQRGIDVDVACDPDGGTFLHNCVLLRDSAMAIDSVRWLLARGADPNRQRNDGQTPLSLALSFGRTELVELMRSEGGQRP
jgi:ankyrin repeat protein